MYGRTYTCMSFSRRLLVKDVCEKACQEANSDIPGIFEFVCELGVFLIWGRSDGGLCGMLGSGGFISENGCTRLNGKVCSDRSN